MLHIRDYATRGKQFSTCVLLDKAEYFLHGKKQDKFDTKQLQSFADFMRAKPKFAAEETNWDYAVHEWDNNNSTILMAETLQTTDYSALNVQ